MDESFESSRRGREAIDVLLSRLSPWELIYLRGRVRNLQIDRSEFAGCSNLPAEIICQIVSHLSHQDLLRCRLVSRSWRATWMQEAVLSLVCFLRFPGRLQSHPPKDGFEKFYLETLHLYRVVRPDTTTKNFVPWDIVSPAAPPADGITPLNLSTALTARFIGELTNIPLPLYNDRKLFWQPRTGRVAVDDLLAGTRVQFATEADPLQGSLGEMLVAGTASIVVLASPAPSVSAEAGRARILHVYHMEHQKWKKITLPAGLSKCYANAETIVATCHGGQAIVWEWDGIARELTMGHRPSLETNPPPYKLFGGKPGVIFHPFEPRSLFLVWFYGYSHAFPIFDNGHQLQYGNDLSPACTFFVVRYERNDDGVWTPTEHFQHSAAIPLVGGESEAGVSDVDLSLDCRKVDSNGTFSLCFLRSRSRFKYPADYWARFTTTIQCFNVLTQKFLEISYQKGPGDNAAGPSVAANNESGTACDKVLPVTRLWNGQMYRVTFDYGDETQEPTVDSEAPGQGVGCFKPRITYDEGWQTEDVQYFECMDAAKNFTDFTLFVDDGLMVSCCRQGYYIFTPNADEDDSWISPSRLSTTVTLEPVDQPELSPPQVMAICHCYAQPQLEGLEYYDPNPRPVPTADMFPNLR